MNVLYLYVPNENVDNCIKYGIKLSEYTNQILSFKNTEKKGISAFLSPRDSELFLDRENYTCLKISTKDIKAFIYNNAAFKITNDKDFICNITSYNIGDYEEPLALIYSTILPESISIYNRIIDVPLLVENSKEFYYRKSIYDMLESDIFTNFEVYQLLLILGQKKGNFTTNKINDKLKLYIDIKNNKKYTKKSNF